VSFTWDVEVSQIPTVRFSRPSTSTGANGLPFDVYVQERYFAKNDVAALENTQLIYFLTEGEDTSDGYKYSVQTMTGTGLDTAYTAKNKTLRYVYNAQPEFSERGSTKHHYNTERHINYMTKIRADQDYSGDFRATQDLFFMTDADLKKAVSNGGGHYKIFKLSSIEQQVLDHFLVSANGALLFGRSTIDEATGRPRVQVDGSKNIIAGDGIIPQFERYAYYIDYTEDKLNVKDFQDAIENIADKRGQSQGNHITVICNRRFSRQKADALQSAINTFAASNNELLGVLEHCDEFEFELMSYAWCEIVRRGRDGKILIAERICDDRDLVPIPWLTKARNDLSYLDPPPKRSFKQHVYVILRGGYTANNGYGLYVGVTAKTPKQRFKEHTEPGHPRAARGLPEHGICLLNTLMHPYIKVPASQKLRYETATHLALSLSGAKITGDIQNDYLEWLPDFQPRLMKALDASD